jgi:hypothetical protein
MYSAVASTTFDLATEVAEIPLGQSFDVTFTLKTEDALNIRKVDVEGLDYFINL